jgi:hypothetical protein
VVVYLLLAAALFEECGYPAVWPKPTGALESDTEDHRDWAVACPHQARRGPAACVVRPTAGPATVVRTAGACWAGLLVVAIDGTCLDVPDDPATRARLGKGTNQYATSGYPQILLVALVACGTRARHRRGLRPLHQR